MGRQAGQRRLAAAAAADGLFSPASQAWSPASADSRDQCHPRSAFLAGEGEPLTVSYYLCLFLLIAFPGVSREPLRVSGNEDQNLTGAVLKDKLLGVKSERVLLMNPWSSVLKNARPGRESAVPC